MKIQTLSERELEVVRLLTRGLIKKQVAAKLDISVNTVRNHTQNIYEKVGASSIGELCFWWNEECKNSPLWVPYHGNKSFSRKKKTRLYA